MFWLALDACFLDAFGSARLEKASKTSNKAHPSRAIKARSGLRKDERLVGTTEVVP
jgi:hypothetical protein